MKKVLILSAMLIALALPTFAAYQVNWSTGFEPTTYTAGVLAPTPVRTLGQDKWMLADNPSYTDEVPMDVTAGAGLGGSQGVAMRFGAGSLHNAAIRDMTVVPGKAYKQGWAKYWVYDPGFTSTTGVDARVGVYGDLGENGIGKMATAQIQDASTRDPLYWYAQWSFSVGKLDGATAVAGGTGYTFTQGAAAPRVWGAWSYAMLTWAFAYTIPDNHASGGSGIIKWYVNSITAPALTLNINSLSGRWANFHDVQGMFMGSGMTAVGNYKPAAYDNVEFHGNMVPEPTSLLALGTGLIGLMGLIRRKR